MYDGEIRVEAVTDGGMSDGLETVGPACTPGQQ
jgi:hypothetical protein